MFADELDQMAERLLNIRCSPTHVRERLRAGVNVESLGDEMLLRRKWPTLIRKDESE